MKDMSNIKLISGILSSHHMDMFIEIPLKLLVSKFMRIGLKESTSHKYIRSIQRLHKRYWVKDFGVEEIFTPHLVML